MRVVVEDAFNHPDIANELYLWGVLQANWVMLEFVKENFIGHPKFHPRMVMFILEKMVLRVELEGVSAVCAIVSTLTVTVQKSRHQWTPLILAFGLWKLPLV